MAVNRTVQKKSSNPVRGTDETRTGGGFQGDKITQHKSRPQTRPAHKGLLDSFRNGMNTFKPLYKDVELYDAGGDATRDWYIKYNFLNPSTGKYQRFKPTFDINRIHDLELKLKYGQQAVKFMKDRLKEGYNPFEEMERMAQLASGQVPTVTVEATKERTCLAELEEVVTALCKISTTNAGQTYRLMLGRLRKFLESKSYMDLTCRQIDHDNVRELQRHLQEKKLARKTINDTKSCLGLFWDELKIKKLVDVNPFREVANIKSTRGRIKKMVKDPFEPPTYAELDRIIDELKRRNKRGMIRFLGMIYYGWARPIEIMRMRVKDIDIQNRALIFRKENTKNEKPGMVQMVGPLYELLQEIDLTQNPADYYLFSGPDFTPGPKMMHQRFHFNDTWNEIVKKGLGIDKNPYSLKHAGNIAYLVLNKGKVDSRWMQMQNRHSSLAQTETYIRKLGVYFVKLKGVKFKSFN